MKKNIIIIILSVLIIALISWIIYLNYWNKEYKNRLENIPNQDDNFKVVSCSFTKTYKISNMWTVDTVEEVPGMTYIMVEQFQNDDKITLLVPTELINTLQEKKYYEFTYTIVGNSKTIKTMNDINNYFEKNNTDSDLKITLNIKETEKVGLEQTQESICQPK